MEPWFGKKRDVLGQSSGISGHPDCECGNDTIRELGYNHPFEQKGFHFTSNLHVLLVQKIDIEREIFKHLPGPSYLVIVKEPGTRRYKD